MYTHPWIHFKEMEFLFFFEEKQRTLLLETEQKGKKQK